MLLFAALATYLLGTFQHFVLETAHTISHQFYANHSYHSHHDDQNNDHEHANLDLSKTALETHSDNPTSQENTTPGSFDKIPQICSVIPLIELLIDNNNKQNPSYQLQYIGSLYLQKLFSPPKPA